MKTSKNKFSKNAKLNSVLTAVYETLNEFGASEVKRYKKEFPKESDYNLAQYGNLLVYYDDVRLFYASFGYKCDKWSNDRLWSVYKRQVGYIARMMF